MDNVLDDILADQRGDEAVRGVLEPALETLHDGRKGQGTQGYVREMTALIDRIMNPMSPAQRKRFHAGVAEFAHGCATEDILRTASGPASFGLCRHLRSRRRLQQRRGDVRLRKSVVR
ncbi:hypothetical protein [Streptomyces sp. NPDC001678]|uniref:hypothetical protein n=1 Tax=Streptomyces sp. NPDC001678 TaxID=3364599 RepID=UPI0036AF4839